MDDSNKPNQKKPTAPKKAKAKIKINKTHQSLLGVFVFAFGFAAVIAVLYLAYAKFYAPSSSAVESVQSKAEVAGVKSEKVKLPSKLSKVAYENIIGRWYVEYDLRSAYVTLNKDMTFEIIVFMDPDLFERRIARGTIEFNDEDSIIRFVSNYDPLPKSEYGITKTLTRRNYNIVALKNAKGQMYWVPHIKEGMHDQLHPMFINLQRKDSFIQWRRVKSEKTAAPSPVAPR